MITLEPRHGLVFLVIMLVQALRPWLERHKVDSAILPWLTLLLSCVVVLPVLIWEGNVAGWQLVSGALAEGVPIGVMSIILYDFGGKPLRKVWRRWRNVE